MPHFCLAQLSVTLTNTGINEIRMREELFGLVISEALMTLLHCFGSMALLHMTKVCWERIYLPHSVWEAKRQMRRDQVLMAHLLEGILHYP